jgi:TPR repeat protein
MRPTVLARVMLAFLGTLMGVAAAAATAGLDSRTYIEKAAALIAGGQHALARTYLAPALIDWRLHPSERSRAYYLNGYSFYAEELYVSAGLDYARALEFDRDNAVALASLGRMYLQGEGMPQDNEAALTLLDRAAELGSDTALYVLGWAYLEKEETRDLVAARGCLATCAGNGHPGCMRLLASSYRAEYADPAEPELARAWYEKANSAGDTPALAALAYMYLKGEFGEPDPQRALELFEQSANDGFAPAMVAAGYAYLVGSGVEADPATGLAWLERGAAAGETTSYVWLGHAYQAGVGAPADPAAARAWFERGHAAGEPEATERLVYLLLSEGSDGSRVQAVELLDDLARGGEPRWLNGYAWLLATSKDGRLRDGRRALEHARRAVEAQRNAAYLDTLAAAHAEMGEFELAIRVQGEAIALAVGDDARLKAELTSRLDAYQHAQPWRE